MVRHSRVPVQPRAVHAVEVANVPGHEARGPDMSSGAAAAFRAVLREVGSETPIFPAPTLLKMLRREPALAWGTAEPALA